MRIKLILIGIGILISALGVFFNPFVIVKKSEVKTWKTNAYNDSVSVAKLSREIIIQDSLLWSLQQDIDILKANESKFQIMIAEHKKRASEAFAAEKRANEAIEHYEQNGLMRYFVFDKRGVFKKGCYEEVFEKPDNICK